jgi:asparagine synthase (glutamine-hydrolysing)
VQTGRFWDPQQVSVIEGKSKDWYAEEFRERFLNAVRSRLQGSSSRIAVHVSGGFDSCAVAAAVQYCRLHERSELETWAFANMAHHRAADERHHVQQVLDHIPMNVVTTESRDFWAFRPAPLVTQWQDEPYTAPYVARVVAELTAARDQGIGVILTGSGGDEVGGSSCYLFDLLAKWQFGRFWPELCARARGKGLSALSMTAALMRVYAGWLDTGRNRGTHRQPPWLNQDLACGLPTRRTGRHTLNPARDDTLRRIRFCRNEPLLSSMVSLYGHFGVEMRQPFLDRRVVEWALAVPPYQFGEAGLLKAPMRRALKHLMPQAILCRSDKANYMYYWDLGVRHRERDRIRSMLQSPISAERGYIDARRLRAEYERYCHGAAIDRRQLWHALTLESWLRNTKDRLGQYDRKRRELGTPVLTECGYGNHYCQVPVFN